MMRQGSNNGGRRPRGRTNRKQHGGGGPSRPNNYDSNGPDGRVRGNARQVYEKYLTLARDAQSSGDRVAAEAYFQHAEHYYRILSDSTDPQRPDRRQDNRPSAAAAEAEAATPVNGGAEETAAQPSPTAEPAGDFQNGAEQSANQVSAKQESPAQESAAQDPVSQQSEGKPTGPKRRGRPRKPKAADQETGGRKTEKPAESAAVEPGIVEAESDPAAP